jgi:hypothetical protein
VGISCTGAKRESDQVCAMLQVREPPEWLVQVVHASCTPLFDVFSKRYAAIAKRNEPQVPNFARMSHNKV